MSVTGLSRVGSSVGAEPQALTDTPSIDNIQAPDVAVPGQVVDIGVRVRCKTVPLGACESAVRITANGEEKRLPTEGQEQIRESNTETFNTTFQMGNSPMNVLVETLEYTDVVGWGSVESQEFVIQPVTQEEKEQREREQLISGAVPWVIGGGVGGAGIGYATGYDILPTAAIGSGVGVAGYYFDREYGFPEVSFPTNELFAIAAVGVAGFLLLSQAGDINLPSTDDLPSIPSPGGSNGPVPVPSRSR